MGKPYSLDLRERIVAYVDAVIRRGRLSAASSTAQCRMSDPIPRATITGSASAAGSYDLGNQQSTVAKIEPLC